MSEQKDTVAGKETTGKNYVGESGQTQFKQGSDQSGKQTQPQQKDLRPQVKTPNPKGGCA